MSIAIELPLAIASSGEFRSLNESQQLSMLRRLDNARSLGMSLATKTRLQASDDFLDFVEDLELDAALLQELDSAPRGGLTRWQIHYSWTFETSPQEMAKSLSVETMALADFQEPGLTAALDEYCIWFMEFGRRLVDVVDQFSAADSFATAMAQHVVLDVLLARLLIACYKLRLNPSMAR